MTAVRRQPGDDIAIVPRLSPAETAMLVAALETRARVYEQSARTFGQLERVRRHRGDGRARQERGGILPGSR